MRKPSDLCAMVPTCPENPLAIVSYKINASLLLVNAVCARNRHVLEL